jgi:hypothetical protein
MYLAREGESVWCHINMQSTTSVQRKIAQSVAAFFQHPTSWGTGMDTGSYWMGDNMDMVINP